MNRIRPTLKNGLLSGVSANRFCQPLFCCCVFCAERLELVSHASFLIMAVNPVVLTPHTNFKEFA